MAERSPLGSKELFDKIAALSGDAVSGYTDQGTKDPYFLVAADRWPTVAQTLKTHSDLAFDFLNCMTAVDWIKQNKMQVVYHLYSYRHGHSAVVKIDLPRDNPEVPSACGVWKAANWLEREQYDLLGVSFTGHPDLRRLLMPDDWVGFPMRKDYKEAPKYRDMPTTRPSTFDLLIAYDKAHGVAASTPTKKPGENK